MKALKAASILVTENVGEIDELKAGVRLGWLPVSWSRFLRRVYWSDLAKRSIQMFKRNFGRNSII